MKEKLQRFGRWLGEAFVRTVRLHPVELALIVYGCAGCMTAYHADSACTALLLPRLALVPLFAALALTVNLLAGLGPWRRVYWVCWLPLVPVSFWSGLPEWVADMPYFVTLGALVPLALLMACRAVENVRFVGDTVTWLRAAALALVFPNVALGLFCAILYSTAYIFGIGGDWVEDVAVYAVILCETLVAPVVLLMMLDRWLGTEIRGMKVIDILLNYIVTPALLIYLVILYLYIARIVVTWSLPEGGVAYLVFGFTIFALVVKALQEILGRRMYDWFFSRFSLFALPPTVLFWTGVVRRVGEYGLTEDRVWLLVCGGVMTLCLLLFLAKRTGRYLYVALAAFVVFAALIYIPSLHPERIALRSQVLRAERIAGRLGLLGQDGRLALRPVSEADTVYRQDYRRLYEALEYVDQAGEGNPTRFGKIDLAEFRRMLLPELRLFVLHGLKEEDQINFSITISTVRTTPVGGYERIVTHLDRRYSEYGDEPGFDFSNDTLRIGFGGAHPEFRISGRELLETQLRCAGVSEAYDPEMLQEKADAFLAYSNGELTVLFSEIRFDRTDSLLSLRWLGIDAVLLR